MRPFALLAEQAEELHRVRAGRAEPVRDAGVELGRLSGVEDDELGAQIDVTPPVEEVVALAEEAIRRLRP